MKQSLICPAATAAAALLVFSACINPRVIVEIDKQLPPTAADKVVAFSHLDSLPEACDTVGRLRIKDSGLTLPSRGTLPYVISYAKKKAAENGANAICIDENRPPARGTSTCRISATMLSLPDAQTSPFTAFLQQQAGINSDAAMVSRVIDDLSHEYRPRNTVKLSTGPAWIYSDIYTASGKRKGCFAMDLMAEYEHTWKSGLGVGATFARTWGFVDDDKVNLTYAGPSIVYAYREAHHWGAEVALGAGYAHYNDGLLSGNGVGFLWKAGAEYLITRHIGLGAELNVLGTTFSEPDGLELPKGKSYGFSRVNLLIGLRAYF